MGVTKYLGIPKNKQGIIELEFLLKHSLYTYNKLKEAINELYKCKEIVKTKTAKKEYDDDIKILRTKSYQINKKMNKLESKIKDIQKTL